MERNLAIEDAYSDYILKRFGKTFWADIEKKANEIDSLYEPEQKKKIIEDLIKGNFKIIYDTDSNQIGYLNRSIFSEYPFSFIIDTGLNKELYNYKFQNDSVVFESMTFNLADGSSHLKLPSISLIVYWDSIRTSYPYPDIPLGKFYINEEK